MAAYFFASPVDIEVKLDGEDERKKVEMKGEKDKTISCPVYYDGDSVSGQVRSQFVEVDESVVLTVLNGTGDCTST